MNKISPLIFCTGLSPRCGTTLLQEAIQCCYEIDAISEHEAPLFSFKALSSRPATMKQPGMVQRALKMLTLDPQLYIICLVRDPRNSISSKHIAFDSEKYFTGAEGWITNYLALQEYANHPRVLQISYEWFTRNPDQSQEMIEAMVPGLDKTRILPFSRYHEASTPNYRVSTSLGGLRPISPDKNDKYLNHLPRVKEYLARNPSLPDILVQAGYEQNDNWLKMLTDIEPGATEEVMSNAAADVTLPFVMKKIVAEFGPLTRYLYQRQKTRFL